ncbi:hypothetical protein MMC30_006854 [Trapelia coarctata]|nr:hypothetical protein [Trapelia coarctata]
MAANTSNTACQDIARLVDQLRQGKSIFSTKLGKWAPRLAESPLSPIIIRTDPVEDMQSMVSSLRAEFPKECREISGPIRNIYDYFDHQDVHMHGLNFIQSVLNQIVGENEERARNLENFAQRWMELNVNRFRNIEADTQEIFDETEKTQHHQRFLHDALELLKAYRLNPPTMPQGFSGSPGSISLPSTVPVAPHLPILENRPSDYRSMVTASRVPSGPQFAQNMFTEPVYNRATAGQRRNSARLSPTERRPLNVPGTQYHGEGKSNAANGSEISTQPLGGIQDTNQQVTLVEPLRAVEACDMGYVYSHQLRSMTSNAGSVAANTTTYTGGQFAPNPVRSDDYRPKGKPATYHGKRSAGLPYGSVANNSRMSSPQFPPRSSNVHGVPRANSADDLGTPVQGPPGIQGGMTPFPVYSLGPLPEEQPPVIQPSSAPLQGGYPQRPPSFGQTGNTYVSTENQYEGYHYGNVELPGHGNHSQTSGGTSGRVGPNQTHLQQPTMYAGNNQTHGRSQGKSAPRQNPRKSFSDDARNLQGQERIGQREFPGDNNRSRRSSSGEVYDAQGSSQPGWQRGHHRQSGSYRGGSRRPSLSQHIPIDRDGVPTEGGFSYMGYFGGGGGSEDFTHLVHQTIQEDRSDGGQRASFIEEAVRTENDANMGNTLPRQFIHTGAAALPTHAQGEKPTELYPYGKTAVHHDRGTAQINAPPYSASPMGFRPNVHQQSFRASGDPAGTRNFNHSQINPPLVDPRKVYVLGDGLTKEEVEQTFEPYGTIVKLIGPKVQTHTHMPMGKPWFWVTYSSPAAAASAIQHLQNFHLSSGERILVRPGYMSQWDGPSMTQFPPAMEVSDRTHWNAAKNAQNEYRGPPCIQEPIPAHDSFRPNQANAYNEDVGRGRRYSERRQDADGVAEFSRRPKETRSPPRTPRKNKKGGKGKSKVSTPTHRGESESELGQSQKEERGGPGKYDGRPQSSDANMVPAGGNLRNTTPVRTQQQKPAKEPRPDRQPNMNNKETKWRRDISEPRPVSLGDIIPKVRESPKKAESRTGKTPQLTSDGSPSRKSRPALRKSKTSDMILEHQTSGRSQEKHENLGELTTDAWPALRKVESANPGQQERATYSTVVVRNKSSEVLDRNVTMALKEAASTATVPKKLNEDQQEASSGHERPHTLVDDRIAEHMETVTEPILSPMKEAATTTQGSTAKKETVNTQSPRDVKLETATTVQPLSSPCVSPRMTDFLNVTDAPWDPCKLPSDSKKEGSHVETPEKHELRNGDPSGRNSPDAARHTSSTSGLTTTQIISDTQTERSESWAELSERNEPSSISKTGNWRGDLSSATSMADPESRRSSNITGLPRAAGERKKDPSASKDAPMVDPAGTLASVSSSVGKSSQGPNANRFRSYRRSAQPNSFDCWRADLEAHASEAGTNQDSKSETATLVNPLKNDASSVKDVPPTAGPSISAETSNKVWTGFESLKGKGKELTIDIPPRTPSPRITDIPAASRSKSPKSRKKKEPLEPVLRSASLSVPVGPISTHMRKKSKLATPTKLMSKKKGAVSKHKEIKVQEPQTPGEIQTAELRDATIPTEPEIHGPSEDVVKVTSDDGHLPEAGGLLPRTPTPYASGSYKEIVQDELTLSCSVKKDGDDHNKVSLPPMAQFEQKLRKTMADRRSKNLNSSSAESQGSFFEKDDPLDYISPDSKDTDTTSDDHKHSERVPTTTKMSQEKSAKAQRSKNRNKNKRAKGKGKEKARSRHSSTSDITVALPRSAKFPTLPLDSPRSSLVASVEEQKMFPPLEVVVQDSEARSDFTESWLRQIEAGHIVLSEGTPPRDVDAEMRAFDQERIDYQRSKGVYETEKYLKFDRLERLANRGGLGIDLGPGMKDGDWLGVNQMPPTPVTPGPEASSSGELLIKGVAASEASGKAEQIDISLPTLKEIGIPRSLVMTAPFKARSASKLEEQAKPESPPLGGPSTPPPLSNEEAAAMARLAAKKADRVLELLRKDYVGSDVPPPPPGLDTDSGKAGLAPEKITPTSSECSTEIDLPLEELSIQVTKPSEESSPAPPNIEGVSPATPVTAIETSSPTVKPSTPVRESEPAAKPESPAELRSSTEPGTCEQLSSALAADLAEENIKALNDNGEIILIFPEDSKTEAGTSSQESPDKPASPPPEPLTPSADHTKVEALTPSSAEVMPPPPPPATSVTDSEFPSLPAAKAPSLETDSPSSSLKLSLSHRRSSARSKLSEANIAALDSTATQPPHQGRQRGASVKSTSEFSTTSSVRRKLFSEAAASPGVSPRHPEGMVGGGQSQSFVGAPAFLHLSPPASPTTAPAQ